MPTTPTAEPGAYLLAISGKMASGKDAVAHEALKQLGMASVRVNLADAIRAELAECFLAARDGKERLAAHLTRYDVEGRHRDQLDQLLLACLSGGDVNRRSTSVRVGLQQLAWLARQQDSGIWIRQHAASVHKVLVEHPGRVVVTTDVREPSEVVALDDAGFVVVRLHVSPQVQRRRLAGRDNLTPDHTLEHPNETALDNPSPQIAGRFAAVIDNDAALSETGAVLAQVLRDRWKLADTPPDDTTPAGSGGPALGGGHA